MTPSEIETALEPFGQVRDSSLHPQEGTSLGLPLARQFAELHGGSLRIDSEKGRGTTVTVTLSVPPSEDSKPCCAIARTGRQLAAAELAATRPARLPAPARASG
jgi:Histidine kinase-, DNA gyrase B-, and HSP90-like ATPase